jgi:hypothetical protein
MSLALACSGVTATLARARRGVARRGVGGLVRLLVSGGMRLAFLRESHVWLLLDLSSERMRVELPVGMTLVRAGEEDLRLLEDLPTVSPRVARRRLAAGVDLWIVREGDRGVFACWTFLERTPALAAPGGWLTLPESAAGLEDSVTSPSCRGRSVGPGAWSAVADALAKEGVAVIVTKVEESNAACRRALAKTGFRHVASMRLLRIAGIPRVEVRLLEAGRAAFLAEGLAR